MVHRRFLISVVLCQLVQGVSSATFAVHVFGPLAVSGQDVETTGMFSERLITHCCQFSAHESGICAEKLR